MEILIAIIILAVGAVWYYNAQVNKVVAKENNVPQPVPAPVGKPADEIVEAPAPAVTKTVKPRAKKPAPAAIKAKTVTAVSKTKPAAKPVKTTRAKKA